MQRVTVEIDDKWIGLVRSPVYWVVAALTGVSITFCPLFLFRLGHEGTGITDWRVLVCFAIIYLVPFVHFRLAAPVMKQVRGVRPGTA